MPPWTRQPRRRFLGRAPDVPSHKILTFPWTRSPDVPTCKIAVIMTGKRFPVADHDLQFMIGVHGLPWGHDRHERGEGVRYEGEWTRRESTIMLRVLVTNGSDRSRSSACSRWRMSAARRCTTASASPETVYAPTTSGWRRAAASIWAGVVRPVQNSSTNASV